MMPGSMHSSKLTLGVSDAVYDRRHDDGVVRLVQVPSLFEGVGLSTL